MARSGNKIPVSISPMTHLDIMHGTSAFNYCPKCGSFIYNKPDILDGLIYLPAGLLHDQIPFRPTVELWTDEKAEWIQKAKSIKASFPDNGTVERLGELLENLEQRE